MTVYKNNLCEIVIGNYYKNEFYGTKKTKIKISIKYSLSIYKIVNGLTL